jgi:hypothetical protein
VASDTTTDERKRRAFQIARGVSSSEGTALALRR